MPEIGWHVVERLPLPEAAYWFGEGPRATLFQWHYDSFDLPPDAQLLARSEACPCQAFGIGPHLAMQFHVELDEAKLLAWTAAHDPRHLAKGGVATVQGAAQMRQDAARFLGAQQRLADRIYARWTGLAARAA